VGGGTGELTGCGVGLGGGELVGGSGLGKGVFVDAGGSVGLGVLVADSGVELGMLVSGGCRVGSGPCCVVVAAGPPRVGVDVALVTGVADEPAGLVAVLSRGGEIDVPPADCKVAVGVGLEDGASATPSGRVISEGVLTPSKSWMISSPIAGTDTGISSIP
jgi:hypothetical protein